MDASVIVPTLNEEKTIRACLASLRDQDFRGSFEVIVSDGHSTDKTVSIARRMADKVVFEEKHVIAAGRQAGAKAARGRVLVFTDADVVLPRNWLAELVKPFGNGGVASVHGNVLLNDASLAENALCRFFFPPYFWVSNALGFPSGAGSNMAVSRKAFKAVDGFDTSLVTGEDIDLQKRVRSFGKTVFNPQAVAFVSVRRVRSWGYPRFVSFHAKNWFRIHLLGSPKEEYERVR